MTLYRMQYSRLGWSVKSFRCDGGICQIENDTAQLHLFHVIQQEKVIASCNLILVTPTPTQDTQHLVVTTQTFIASRLQLQTLPASGDVT